MHNDVTQFGFNPPIKGQPVSLIFASGVIGLSSPEPGQFLNMNGRAVIDFQDRIGMTMYDTKLIDPRFPRETMRFMSSWDTSLTRRVLNEASPAGKACRYLALMAYDFPVLRAGSDTIATVMGRDIAAKHIEGRIGSDIRRAVSVAQNLCGIPSRQKASRRIPRPFRSSSEDSRPEHIRGHCAISMVLRTKAFPANQPPKRLIRYMPQKIRKAIYKRLDDFINIDDRSAA